MTTKSENQPTVVQMRVIVEAEDYEAAVRFYRDVLGLQEQAAFEGDGGARVAILEAGRATLEIANPAQTDDRSGRGRPPGGSQDPGRLRGRRQRGDDPRPRGRRCRAHRAPIETPWRSLNSRLSAPAGLQITLFEELEPPDSRSRAGGFGTDAPRAPETRES